MAKGYLEDEELLRGVLARHETETRCFVHRFGSLFRRQALGRIDYSEVEDVVQGIFLALLGNEMRALRAWKPHLGRSLRVFLAWFADKQIRTARRRRSLRASREVLTVDLGHDTPCMRSLARQVEDRNWLEYFVARLKPTDRQLVILLFVEQRSLPETIQLLGINRQVLYQRTRRLRQRAHWLSDREFGHAQGPLRSLGTRINK